MIKFETYREFGGYEISQMKQEDPSCFNGMVRVKRYMVTIEEIPETKDVIKRRLESMLKGARPRVSQDILLYAKRNGIEINQEAEG